MGKDRSAEAAAAASRETARQFDELRKEASKVKYDKDEVLENLKRASEQIPELVGLYEAAQQDPSALEDIATNPKFLAIQEGNLEAMQEMAEESGFSESDMAKRRALERQASASDSARQKSIVQDMMARGQGGSGTELLARLGSAQAATQRQAEAGDRLAMDSSTARKQALAQASQQAGNLRQQDYGEKSSLANARDQIAQFNAMNRTNTNNRNLELRQGQEAQRSGQKANYYANVANTEQQRFANEMSRLGLQSNAIGNAGQARLQATQTGKKPSTLGMIGTVGGAVVGGIYGGPAGASAGAAAGGAVGNAAGGMTGYKDGGIRHKYTGGTQPGQFSNNTGIVDGINTNFQDKPSLEELQMKEQFIKDRQNEQGGFDPNRPIKRRSTAEAFGASGLGSMFNSDKPAEAPPQAATPPLQDEEDIFGKSLFDDKDNQEVLRDDLDVKEVNGKSIDSGADTAATLGAISNVMGQLGKQNQAAPAPAMPKYSQEKIAVQSMPGFSVEEGGVKPNLDEMRDNLMSQVSAFANGGLKYEDGGVEDEGKDFGYEGRELLEAALDRQPDDYNEMSDMLDEQGHGYEEGGVDKVRSFSEVNYMNEDELEKYSKYATDPFSYHSSMMDKGGKPPLMGDEYDVPVKRLEPTVEAAKDMKVWLDQKGKTHISDALGDVSPEERDGIYKKSASEYGDKFRVLEEDEKTKAKAKELNRAQEREAMAERGNLPNQNERKAQDLEDYLSSLRKYNEGGVSRIDDELIQATQMLRTNNQPAPGAPMPGGQPPMPMPPQDMQMPPQGAPMPPQGMPMPPQGMAPQQPPMPPQGMPMPPQGMPMPPQMPPQGQAMADGGMAYEDGGEGTIIPGQNFEGDDLPDRINSGEMVLNVEQQDRLNDALMELKRLKSRERTDKMLAKGEIEANPMQQESLMSFVRGEIDIDEVPNERVVKEPSVGEPSGNMAQLLGMVSKKRRG